MLLQLDDEHRITNDKLNYILERFEEIKDRKTREVTGHEWKQLGYFGKNLSMAIKRYVNEKVKDSETMEVKDLLVKLDEISKHVERVVNKQNIDFVYVGKKGKDDE